MSEMEQLWNEVAGEVIARIQATPEPTPEPQPEMVDDFIEGVRRPKEVRDLKAGDKVIVYGSSVKFIIAVVSKITPAGFIVVTWNDGGMYARFKPDGAQHISGWRRMRIEVWSQAQEDELRAEAAEKAQRIELIAFIESRSYRNMSTATLLRIQEAIKSDPK